MTYLTRTIVVVACALCLGCPGKSESDTPDSGASDDVGDMASLVPDFRVESEDEIRATLVWNQVPEYDEFRLWSLADGARAEVSEFGGADWIVAAEAATPPRVVERNTFLLGSRWVLEGLRDGKVEWQSEEIIVRPAIFAAAPHVAVGDGVAFVVWDNYWGNKSLTGDAVDWEILRDGAVVDRLEADQSATSYVAEYLDLTGVVTGQTYEYRIGRLPSAQDSALPGLPTTVTIESWTQIDATEDHTCATTARGTAYCWGDNTYGQLGAGDNEAKIGAIAVVDGDAAISDVVDVAVTARSSCARRTDGTVWCWGASLTSDGTDFQPTLQQPGVTVESLTGGAEFLCALSSGEVWCWGANDQGQLGRGTSTPREASARVLTAEGPLTDVVEVSAGLRHACARTTDGMVYCWGSSDKSQLAGPSATVATPVEGLAAATRVWAGGDESCAQVEDRLWCWGERWNRYTSGSIPIPQDATPEFAAGEQIVEVAVGRPTTLTTTLGRTFRAGDDPAWIAFGQGKFATPLSGSTVVASGLGFACTLNRDRLLVCEGTCSPFSTYNPNQGCAGGRLGTAPLNRYQRSDVVYVISEGEPPYYEEE